LENRYRYRRGWKQGEKKEEEEEKESGYIDADGDATPFY
jgi:hypothetical protein